MNTRTTARTEPPAQPSRPEAAGTMLKARLAALGGTAPAPRCHILFRATRLADGDEVAGYQLPDQADRLGEEALERWLAEQGPGQADRLAVSVLVIRETLDAAGLVRRCSLERRRGAPDGPFHGDPARVDFIGPAQLVRRYRATPDDTLIACPSGDLPPATPPPGPEPDIPGFAGETQALRTHFGGAVTVIDRREPTASEDLAELSAIVHVRSPDGREIGCGIGWHGTTAFVLVGAFARRDDDLVLTAADMAMMAPALQAHALAACETRLDRQGLAIIGRRHGQADLFILRLHGVRVQVDPYAPDPDRAAHPDQRRWLRYAEAHEGRTILDTYQQGPAGDLVVLTAEPDGLVWRHHVDPDGVETLRRPDDQTAAGLLYQERIRASAAGPDGDATTNPPDPPAAPPPAAPPMDSMLAKAQALDTALALLREARAACQAAPRADAPAPASALPPLRALPLSLRPLSARLTATAAGNLIRAVERQAVTAALAAQKTEAIEDRLLDELTVLRVATMVPSWSADAGSAFAGIGDHFPDASYHIEEAALCLALRRPTAAVFHAMRIVQIGLRALAGATGLTLTDAPAWAGLIGALREADPRATAPVDALDAVRRCWRSHGLVPADKYTEEEAEALLDAVAGFMRSLIAWRDGEARSPAATPA